MHCIWLFSQLLLLPFLLYPLFLGTFPSDLVTKETHSPLAPALALLLHRRPSYVVSRHNIRGSLGHEYHLLSAASI